MWTHVEYIYVTCHSRVDATRGKLGNMRRHLEGRFGEAACLGLGADRRLPIQPIVNSFCRAVPPPGAVKADQAFLNRNFLFRSTVLADFPS